MSYVGSGIVGQRLDQPQQFSYINSSPKKQFSLLDNNNNININPNINQNNELEQVQEQENVYPRPLDFEKKSEKIDYFHALKDLGPTQPIQQQQESIQVAKPLKQQTRKPQPYKKPVKQSQYQQKQPQKPQKVAQKQPQKSYQRARKQSPEKEETMQNIPEVQDEEDLESRTESHVCSYLCDLEENMNFDMSSMGDASSCVCTECGDLYAQVKAEAYPGLTEDDGFHFPAGFDPQEILQKKWEQEVFARKSPRQQHITQEQYQEPSTDRSHTSRSYQPQRKEPQYQQYQQQQYEFSRSPPKDADIDTQIRYQQQKVARMQQKVQQQPQQQPQQRQSIQKPPKQIQKGPQTHTKQKPIQQQQKQQQSQSRLSQQKQKQPSQQQPKKSVQQQQAKQNQNKVYGKSMQKKTKKNFMQDQLDIIYSDDEAPQQYDVQPSKAPHLSREVVANAQELALRNNLLYKQKKQEEEQQKIIEQEKQEQKKKLLKLYSQKVKNQNLSKVQKQKLTGDPDKEQKFTGHQYAWGADQQHIQEYKTKDERKEKHQKFQSTKPESVTKYNEVSQFFSDVPPSNWLEKIQTKVKDEITEIKKPKPQKRRRSLEIVRLQNEGKDIESLQPKPFDYLRSKSTNQRKGDKEMDEDQKQQSSKVKQRGAIAYEEIVLKKKQEKVKKEKKINNKLKELDEKQKIILANTRMEKYIPPDAEKLKKEQEEELTISKQFGNKSVTRFNLDNQYEPLSTQQQHQQQQQKQQQQQSQYKDFNNYKYEPKYKKSSQQYSNSNYEYQREQYNQQDENDNDDNNYQEVFGQKAEVVSKKKAGDRLVIGFSNKTEDQEIKNKQGEVLVGWSKTKIEKEKKQKDKIQAQEKLRELQEEREQLKRQKQQERQRKLQQKNDYDEYGYHKQTGEYDEFFDKYNYQNQPTQQSDADDNNNNEKAQENNYKQFKSVEELELENQIQQHQQHIRGIEQEEKEEPFQYKKSEKHYDINRDGYQFKPQNAEFVEVMDQNSYNRFLDQQKHQQQKIKQLTQQREIKLKDERLTEEEQKLAGDIQFLDNKGKQLSQQQVRQLMETAEIPDLEGNVRGRGRQEQNEEYYQSVEKEIIQAMQDKKRSKSNKKKSAYQRDTEPPLELRRQIALKKAQMEADRLREPDMDQIFKKYKGIDDLGEDTEQRAEKWGELDGVEIRGTQPYWDDLKDHCKATLFGQESDDDEIYVRKEKRVKPKKDDYQDLEVLERIDRFNEHKLKQNLRAGKHRRIPLEDADVTVYSERCKQEKEKQKEREKQSKKFSKHVYDDSDEEELGGFKPSYGIPLNQKQDKIFTLNANDLMKMDKIPF